MQAKKEGARHAAKRQLVEMPKSTELYLINQVLKSKEPAEQFASLQSIIYNFTSETRQFGYKAGFALGELVGRNFEFTHLQKLFENAGFGKLLYTPTEREAIVIADMTSEVDAGMPMHVFEAGMLAGFFSAKTGRVLGAEESHCQLNGSKCTFFIGAGKMPRTGALADFSKATDAIADSLEHAKACKSYYILSFLPILEEPLLSSSAKLAYLLGKKLGYRGVEPGLLAKYLQVEVKMSGKEMEVSYPYLLSHSGYVLVSSMLLRGYLQTSFKKKAVYEQHLRKGIYEVKLSLV